MDSGYLALPNSGMTTERGMAFTLRDGLRPPQGEGEFASNLNLILRSQLAGVSKEEWQPPERSDWGAALERGKQKKGHPMTPDPKEALARIAAAAPALAPVAQDRLTEARIAFRNRSNGRIYCKLSRLDEAADHARQTMLEELFK